jgi:RimJ/RimL family protein N-acetyltransferase
VTEPFLPFRTERLLIRPMVESDIAALHAYRNGPHVEYQSWELPYSMGDAEVLVRDSARHDGPVPGDWIQIAIDQGGELVGDVAVGLDKAGRTATVGFTLRADMQGRGIAREAVRAVVDRLFEHLGVHRIQAETAVENERSIRLLLALGFMHEGTTRDAEWSKGRWWDAAHFGLLASDPRPLTP